MQQDTGAQPTDSGAPDSPPRRRGPTTWLLVIAALAVGLGLGGVVWGRDSTPDTPTAQDAVPSDPSSQVADDPTGTATGDGSVPQGAPGEVVTAFLDALATGDDARSFAQLSRAAQESWGPTVARWTATRPSALPPVTQGEVLDAAVEGDRATVLARVGFEPSLDEVAGLVPARARVSWALVAQDGKWRIDLDASELEPLLPPDDGAREAAAAWVAARQRCEQRGPQEPLPLGDPGLANELCDAPGDVEVGAVEELAEADAVPFQTAYGADATDWARTVTVVEPRALRIVLAPVGAQWTIIGLQAAPG